MAETTKKVTKTKKMVLTAIMEMAKTTDVAYEIDGVEITMKDVEDYVTKTIEQLDSKAKKAAERAKEKREENDEMLAAIEGLLTDEYQTGGEILTQLNDTYEATPAKVTARLTKLCKAGIAQKDDVKTEDGRKLKGYALVNVE